MKRYKFPRGFTLRPRASATPRGPGGARSFARGPPRDHTTHLHTRQSPRSRSCCSGTTIRRRSVCAADDLWIFRMVGKRALRRRRVLLAAPVNEIIIGGLSHSSSTAVAVGMVVRWCAVVVAAAVTAAAAAAVLAKPSRAEERKRDESRAISSSARARVSSMHARGPAGKTRRTRARESSGC